jgi:hypothetical protein
MTLPDEVLYKSQGKTKANPIFAQSDQDLSWSSIQLPKRGAALRLKLKVNATNCADGRLEFGAAVTASGCPTIASTPVYSTVAHSKNWAACTPPTPSGACDDLVSPNVYACGPNVIMCDDGLPEPTADDFAGCMQECLIRSALYARFCESCTPGTKCVCIVNPTRRPGTATTSLFYALEEPQIPPFGECGRRLEAKDKVA